MLKDIIYSLLLSWLFCSSIFAQIPIVNESQIETFMNHHASGYTNLEHKVLGDDLELHWQPLVAPEALHLENGLMLSYGDIIMFGGDLFGNPKQPISSCAVEQQSACFMAQFQALTAGSFENQNCRNPINQVNNLQIYLTDLHQQLANAQSQGIPSWDFYKKNNPSIAKTLNKLTCGGSFISDFIPFGQFLLLAQVNFDHFVPDALTAYTAGHQAALQTALQAHEKLVQEDFSGAQQLLETAYAENAFASHFLSDAMSSGHMRVPRRAIHNKVLLPKILNLLIANLMHDEDSRLGLQVVNQHGISWKAYGDGRLTKPDASTHYEILHRILQTSADAVYQTFIIGQLPDAYEELTWLPNYQIINDLNNHAPLFKEENGKLLKRKQNHEPYDYHWTRWWNGLVTLLDFQMHSLE